MHRILTLCRRLSLQSEKPLQAYLFLVDHYPSGNLGWINKELGFHNIDEIAQHVLLETTDAKDLRISFDTRNFLLYLSRPF